MFAMTLADHSLEIFK